MQGFLLFCFVCFFSYFAPLFKGRQAWCITYKLQQSLFFFTFLCPLPDSSPKTMCEGYIELYYLNPEFLFVCLKPFSRMEHILKLITWSNLSTLTFSLLTLLLSQYRYKCSQLASHLAFPISSCQIKLYSEPDFQGECYIFNCKQEEMPEKLVTKSCRVTGRR